MKKQTSGEVKLDEYLLRLFKNEEFQRRLQAYFDDGIYVPPPSM